MVLAIKTTGLEQYAAGGEGRLQILIIGGQGAGKTRMSSYFPSPIYANCEAGLASIADRSMPYVDIRTSQDMLDLLAHMKQECRQPYRNRQFQTIVVDTIDAFQRLVKDEWLRANPGAQSFRGFDAWGYLDAKMQMLLTRLLNLDMNVIVLAHFKDKTIREGVGENATERQELMLQLSGDIKDSIFNDFDLVGWIGTFWDVEDGVRVEKRGLTFKRTPEKPFLKDRLHVTPPWMEVTFSDSDYANLFAAVISRLDDFTPSEDIGEITSAFPDQPSGGVVGPHSGGALPAQDPADIPLTQFDKVTLQKMARDLGIEFKGNTIKAELVEAIEAKRAAVALEPTVAAEPAVFGDATSQASAASTADATGGAEAEPAASTPVAAAATTTGGAEATAPQPAVGLEDLAVNALATRDEPTGNAQVVATEVGEVDVNGVVMSAEEVAAALGGVLTSGPPAVDLTRVVEEAAVADPGLSNAQPAGRPGQPTTCEWPLACSAELATQDNQDYVKLSHIKYRRYACNEHFLEAKRLGLRVGFEGFPA